MRNKCFDNCRGVFTTVLNDVQDPWGKASVTEYSANEIVSAGAEFGCFEPGKMLAEEAWGHYTTVFPQAIGATTARRPSNNAAFQGAIPTTTPYGSFTTSAIDPIISYRAHK